MRASEQELTCPEDALALKSPFDTGAVFGGTVTLPTEFEREAKKTT